MGIAQRVRDAISGRRTVATQGISNQISLSALCDAYGNLFAQVRPLVDEMTTIVPYGTGRNGAPLAPARTPELVALQTPNEEMGWEEFADAMFVTWLTENELNVRVWKDSRGKIFGYSILPVNSRQVLTNGETIFRFSSNGEYLTLSRDEVMTFRYSRSPRNLDKGVSPASSVFTWTQVDDLMAQLQKAILENGAIPASITFIRASTKAKYDEARKELEAQYHGARNKGKTLFVWRGFDNATGQDVDQVEIKTIQAPNSTLAIKDIMAIINDKINKAYGVSNFILGDDSSAKYDNAEMSQLQFIRRRVYPALRKFWGQFQHELDRVTGGLGYSIQFDLDVPELTDRQKTRAETAKIYGEALRGLIESGASPSAAVSALELDPNWKSVADGIYSRASADKTVTEPSGGDGNLDTNTAPSMTKTRKPEGRGATSTIDASPEAVVTWAKDEVDERKIYDQLMRIAQAIADEEEVPVEEVVEIIADILNGRADDGADVGAKHIASFDLEEAIKGEIEETLAGQGFQVSEEFKTREKARTQSLVDKFAGDTQQIVAEVLNTSREEGLSANEIEKELSKVMPRSRAQTIARNEVVHAFRAGRLANDEYLAQKYGLKIKKVWKTQGDGAVCSVCSAMNNKVVGLRDSFPDQVEDEAWEHSRWNLDGEIPQAHVNCRCYFDEEVV